MTPYSSHSQVASYGVRPRYALVTYATEPKVVIRVSEPKSSDADWVTEKLNQINYEGQRLSKGSCEVNCRVREVRVPRGIMGKGQRIHVEGDRWYHTL